MRSLLYTLVSISFSIYCTYICNAKMSFCKVILNFKIFVLPVVFVKFFGLVVFPRNKIWQININNNLHGKAPKSV